MSSSRMSLRGTNSKSHPGQVVIDAGDEDGVPLKLRAAPKPRRSKAQVEADEAREKAEAARKADNVKRVATLEDRMVVEDAKAKAEASHPPVLPRKIARSTPAKAKNVSSPAPAPASGTPGKARASSQRTDRDDYVPVDEQGMDVDGEFDSNDSEVDAPQSTPLKGKGKEKEKAPPRGKGPARQSVMAQREEPPNVGTPLSLTPSGKRKAAEDITQTNGVGKKSRGATPSGLIAAYAPIQIQPRSSSLMSARSTPSSPLSQSMVIDDPESMAEDDNQEDLVSALEVEELPGTADPRDVTHVEVKHLTHSVKVEHNRPRERLSRSVTPASAASTSKRENGKFNNSDLPTNTLDEFTKTYVPIAREICSLLRNPWKFTTSTAVLAELQETWTIVVFPDIPHTISWKGDPVWEVSRQRVYEYRSAFGPAAEEAVRAFWPSSGMDTDARRAEFVAWAVPLDEKAGMNMPFAWASKGLLQTDTIAATLASHYKAILGSGVDERQLSGQFPVGALALAAAAVNRAFDKWRTGVELKGGKGFNESTYGHITAMYATPVSTITERRRDRIAARARALAFPASTDGSSATDEDLEAAKWELVEPDSEEEGVDDCIYISPVYIYTRYVHTRYYLPNCHDPYLRAHQVTPRRHASATPNNHITRDPPLRTSRQRHNSKYAAPDRALRPTRPESDGNACRTIAKPSTRAPVTHATPTTALAHIPESSAPLRRFSRDFLCRDSRLRRFRRLDYFPSRRDFSRDLSPSYLSSAIVSASPQNPLRRNATVW
ncbi:hypothetical protein PLICRDRAFT_170758 [Plicaturopsis crispa FD-325 SS-3]|nr:hypothetical protein PLICRDRAFT_170758 [Plicaturopsis crispa FD-325 SS-3]